MKTMLINVTHAEESRVGIVEDGQLESFEIESLSREHVKGNLYKAIVRRIHPAIEAAFVDIGAGRDAFLPLDEICFRNLPSGRNGSSGERGERGERGRRRIKDVLKSGDEVLVQITKEQFTNKPPTVSTFYSLPGRYLVLLPGSDDAGISRKIEGEDRTRIRELLGNLKPPPGCGIIIRTAAGFDEEQGEELARDLNYLQRLWESIRKNAENRRAPTLVYREHDVVLRNIRDYFTPDVDGIWVDDVEAYERVRDFLQNVAPGKEHLLHHYVEEEPIFSHFGLEEQIESIYKRRVPLKSGGSIVIEATEAMTSIDVNSGGSMRGASQEDTAHRTNLEAAREIARQLRLRDLGGIIVIDFIDMRVQSHVNEVERTIRDAMRPDKARHDIGRVSRLGLLEISRQRLRPAAAASAYATCPMCEGHGSIRTTESAALVTLRQIQQRIAQADVALMKVNVPHDVAMYLLNQKRDALAQLETRFAARIQVTVGPKLMAHQSEIEVRTRDVIVPLPVVRPGEVATAEFDDAMRARGPAPRRGATGLRAAPSSRPRRSASAGPGEAQGDAADGSRRRGRRGGRGRRRPDEEAGAPLEESAEHLSSTVPDASSVADVEPVMLDVPAQVETSALVEREEYTPPAIPLAPSADVPATVPESGTQPIYAAPGERIARASRPLNEERAPSAASEPEPRAFERAPQPAEPPREVRRDPRDDDPRLRLYLLTDGPVGMQAVASFPEQANGEAAPVPGRRRRRRGGRRSRRRGEGGAAGAPEGTPSGDPGAVAAQGPAEGQGGERRSGPRRRRRGGSGRRRRPPVEGAGGEPNVGGGSAESDVGSGQNVAGPAERPGES